MHSTKRINTAMIKRTICGNGWFALDYNRSLNALDAYYIGETERASMSLFDEYVQVLNEQEGNIVIPMSGGIDSETVAEAAVRAGIPWEPAIMNLIVDGKVMNTHDTEHAVKFCHKHGVTPRFYDLDLIPFLESDLAHQYAANCNCVSPQLQAHLWLLDEISGTPVMPGDFHWILNNKFTVSEFKYFAYDFWHGNTKREYVAKMLSHTPELVQSSLELQVNNPVQWYTQYDRKCQFFALGGFDAQPKPQKQTGFEKILEHFQKKYNGDNLYQAFNDRYRKPLQIITPDTEIRVTVGKSIATYLRRCG